jgi:palmitoyltransferase
MGCDIEGHPTNLPNRWRNKEGERLADFGLDEDAEFYDEDNLPLSEIMRRRQAQ